MTEKFTVERFTRIYDDENGFYYEIRPDADGLDCVAVWYCDNQKETDKSKQDLCVTPALARLIGTAMIELADRLAGRDSGG